MKESKPVTKDTICGMTVDEATELNAEWDGKTFYSHGEKCHERFLAHAQPASCGKGTDSHHDHSYHEHATGMLSRVIRTDEELMIVRLVCRVLKIGPTSNQKKSKANLKGRAAFRFQS